MPTIEDSAKGGTLSFKGTEAEKPVAAGEFEAAPSFREDIGKGAPLRGTGPRVGPRPRAARSGHSLQLLKALAFLLLPPCCHPAAALSQRCPPCSAGTWAAAGYHLATTIATPAAYAYLPFAFAGLGWAPGIICLLLGIAVTW